MIRDILRALVIVLALLLLQAQVDGRDEQTNHTQEQP